MSDVSSNMQPPQTPWDNSEVLRREADVVSTGTGPQGSAATITRDSLIPPGPSQQGIPGSSKDESFTTTYNPSSPQLVAPHTLIENLANLTPQILENFDSFANFVTGGNTVSTKEEVESFFSLAVPEQVKAKIFEKSAEPKKEAEVSKQKQTDEKGKEVQSQGQEKEADIYGPEGDMLNGLYSTDPNEVQKALYHFLGFDDLDQNQKTFFEEKFKGVATNIAQQNAKGDIPGLLSQNPDDVAKTIATILSQANVSLSPEDQKVVQTATQHFGTTVANLNKEAANPPPVNVSLESQKFVKEMASTDPNTVYQALLAYSDLGDKFKTPEDKAKAQASLKKLANLIAQKNSSGGVPDLESFDPKTMGAALLKLLNDSGALDDATSDFKSSMQDLMGTIGENAAPLNAASGIQAPENPTFHSINGTDPQQILQALISLTGVNQSTLTQDQLSTLQQLASKIADENKTNPNGFGLESVAVGTIKETLTNLLGEGITPDMTKLVGVISSNLASINLKQWEQLSLSTDPKIVEKALDKLSNIDYRKDLSPQDKAMMISYLKIMAMALAFMSKIRAEISIMNSQFTQKEAFAKQKNIEDQTRVAEKAYTDGMKQIGAWLDAKLASLSQSTDFMKIFGPILTVVLAIVAVVIIVCTSGAGTAAGIALICATVAIATFTVLDATLNILDRLIDAMGITDPILASVVKMIFMCAITLVVIIASGGAVAIASIEQMTMKAVMEALKSMLMTFLQRGMALATTMCMVGSAIFQSGAINTTLLEALKKMGLDEQDAMIISTVMMLLMMILFMLTCMAAGSGGGGASGGKAGFGALKSLFGGGGEEGAGAVSQGAKSTAATTEEEVSQGVGTASKTAEREAAEDAIGGAKGAKGGPGSVGTSKSLGELQNDIEENLESGFIMKMLNNIARRMKESLKDPQNYADLLQLLAGMLQAAGQIEQGEYHLTMAKLEDTQAQLERLTAQSQAMLTFLQGTISGFEPNIESINQDSKNLATFVNDLCKLFAQMIDGMSDSMTKLHATS